MEQSLDPNFTTAVHSPAQASTPVAQGSSRAPTPTSVGITGNRTSNVSVISALSVDEGDIGRVPDDGDNSDEGETESETSCEKVNFPQFGLYGVDKPLYSYSCAIHARQGLGFVHGRYDVSLFLW
jgi:hypothetical protein